MTAAPQTEVVPRDDSLYPLDEFFRRRGSSTPTHERIPAEALPELGRRLLAHQRDMTGALERFHGASIHLRILSRSHDGGDDYWRESVLELDGTNEAVEFGAIRIFLNRFPEPWRSEILAERRPLGALLNESGLRFSSRPTAYFRMTPDAFIVGALRLATAVPLYGRQNALRDEAGGVLAEIVEILPPDKAERP